MHSDADKTTAPDIRELRHFGITTGAMVAVLFGAAIPWIWDLRYPLWPWVTLAVLAFWALIAPGSLGPVYKSWMRVALVISKITTPVLLGIVFFFVFVPIGLMIRIFSRDPLHRDFEPGEPTYRVATDRKSVQSLERPY
jgi:hypothetical protein